MSVMQPFHFAGSWVNVISSLFMPKVKEMCYCNFEDTIYSIYDIPIHFPLKDIS